MVYNNFFSAIRNIGSCIYIHWTSLFEICMLLSSLAKDNLVNTGMDSLVQCFPKKQNAKPKLNQKYDHQSHSDINFETSSIISCCHSYLKYIYIFFNCYWCSYILRRSQFRSDPCSKVKIIVIIIINVNINTGEVRCLGTAWSNLPKSFISQTLRHSSSLHLGLADERPWEGGCASACARTSLWGQLLRVVTIITITTGNNNNASYLCCTLKFIALIKVMSKGKSSCSSQFHDNYK